MKSAGLTEVNYNPVTREHFLKNEDGKVEIWVSNKNHAGYGIIYKNTHLEFCSTLKEGL